MKKIFTAVLNIILVLSIAAALIGCGRTKEELQSILDAEKTVNEADSIPDTCQSSNGKYEVAMCVSNSELKDRGYNELSYNGVKEYAVKRGKTYKYYIPAKQPTDNDYYYNLIAAINNGAEVVVSVSYSYTNSVNKAAAEHPDVKFMLVDGSGSQDVDNILSVGFREQEGGYLAGYAAVKEGFTKLGFCGGGGGSGLAVNRYGRGYVQGAEDAAREMGITVEMNYSYQYGSAYIGSPELQAMANAWYENGTEVIFSCGGAMFESIAAAAAANDAYVIGADSDLSSSSSSVLTSALKKVDVATELLLEGIEDIKPNELTRESLTIGLSDNAVGLPTDSWKMKNFTIEEYEEIKEKIISGAIVVDTDISNNRTSENLIFNMM